MATHHSTTGGGSDEELGTEPVRHTRLPVSPPMRLTRQHSHLPPSSLLAYEQAFLDDGDEGDEVLADLEDGVGAPPDSDGDGDDAADGAMCAQVHTTWVLIEQATGKPKRVPEWMLDLFA